MSAAAGRMLEWYDQHGRTLPWRAKAGSKPDVYHVWLSEVMLQQTTVTTVRPYFEKFLVAWPTIGELAAADRDEVLTAWAGLGYYSRARNLHACARHVVDELGGVFPQTEEGLRELPGVGPYTAAAIAAIAFDEAATVVDGNVERVMARYFAVEEPLPAAKKALRELAARLTPRHRSGDYAQAVMDLGATVCTPRSPVCALCPWSEDCKGRRLGLVDRLPARTPKKPKPTRRATIFWIERPDGSVLFRQRPDQGLLGGMMEVPSSPWTSEQSTEEEILANAPAGFDWRALPGLVRHTFTHFHLELAIMTAGASQTEARKLKGDWIQLQDVNSIALPTVMKKVVAHATSDEHDEHKEPITRSRVRRAPSV